MNSKKRGENLQKRLWRSLTEMVIPWNQQGTGVTEGAVK